MYETSQVVWAEWPDPQGTIWWPCVVLDPSDSWAVEPLRDTRNYLVLWLGTGELSEVNPGMLRDFWKSFNDCVDSRPKNKKTNDVMNTLIEISSVRAKITLDPEENKIDWGKHHAKNLEKLVVGQWFYSCVDKTQSQVNSEAKVVTIGSDSEND